MPVLQPFQDTEGTPITKSMWSKNGLPPAHPFAQLSVLKICPSREAYKRTMRNTSYKTIVGTGMRQPPDCLIQVDVLKSEYQCGINEYKQFKQDIVVKRNIWKLNMSGSNNAWCCARSHCGCSCSISTSHTKIFHSVIKI